MELTHHKKTMDFSVTQGPTQGAYLFICYASTLNEILPKSLTLNGFAHDHSIRKSFKPAIPKGNGTSIHTNEDDTITIVEKSMFDIKSLMDAVKLKLTESKIKFIYCDGRQQLAKIHRDTININGETIKCTIKLNTLEVTLSHHLLSKIT